MRTSPSKECLYNKRTLFNCHLCYVHRRDSIKTNNWAVVWSYIKTSNIYNFKCVKRLAGEGEVSQILYR